MTAPNIVPSSKEHTDTSRLERICNAVLALDSRSTSSRALDGLKVMAMAAVKASRDRRGQDETTAQSPWVALKDRVPEFTKGGGDPSLVINITNLDDDCPAHPYHLSNPEYVANGNAAKHLGTTHWMRIPPLPPEKATADCTCGSPSPYQHANGCPVNGSEQHR